MNFGSAEGLPVARDPEREGLLNSAKRRPVGSLPPSKPLTGPAPPRRSVCAPGAMSPHCTADQIANGGLPHGVLLVASRPGPAAGSAEPPNDSSRGGAAGGPLLAQRLP